MRTAYDPEFEPTTAERMARNDAVFRDANERIRAAAEGHDLDPGRVPFICECADPGCREIVRLTLAEYQEVRENHRCFLNVPGHEAAEGNAEVVSGGDRYVIVEKVGEAGAVAEELAAGGGELVAPRGEEEGSTGG